MDDAPGIVHEMVQAIDAVTRYATRGCSSMSCDRAREALMGNHLTAIGRAAARAAPELRQRYPEVPWARLSSLADEEHGVVTMAADSMQHFVEHVLPQVAAALKRE